MDEVAIMEKETVGKRAKLVKHCDKRVGEGDIGSLFSSSSSSSSSISPSPFPPANIFSLPVELILEILSYLTQKDLCNMARVSRYFEGIVYDPVVWPTYEVKRRSGRTSEIVERLSKMLFLRELTIKRRPSSDKILRQISLTNKNLKKLNVYNCTGTISKHLHSHYLTRILKKCRRLHTIRILGSTCRGRKLYKLLGGMGWRLKSLSISATTSQLSTFVKHAPIERKCCLKTFMKHMGCDWRRQAKWHLILKKQKAINQTTGDRYFRDDIILAVDTRNGRSR